MVVNSKWMHFYPNFNFAFLAHSIAVTSQLSMGHTNIKIESTLVHNSNNYAHEKWSKQSEFLFSCISLSVGLGNVWRFPFVALENGGGAFLIPYIIVLILIGRPIYYMETIIGQFSNRCCVRAFDIAPVMRGVAYGQLYITALATTYYGSVMALTIKYLLLSFSEVLPWTVSKSYTSMNITAANQTIRGISNAEHFFTYRVLREKSNISDGLGTPNYDLVLCLLVAWILITVVLIRGIKSIGKCSYFLGTFPYIVMIILLVRVVSLPGSINGIIFFLKPQWQKLANLKVWYHAVTQMFFSLAICLGTLITYASYNNFRRNVYKDVCLITSIDSLTSIIAGCIIFGILGNSAFEVGSKDIDVARSGAGLAFISYPEAIAKLKYIPNLFSILFFSMLLVLGIGSNIGMTSCLLAAIKDRFQDIPHWIVTIVVTSIGFLAGIIYTTPGGQYVVNLVDFFGCSFIALFMAVGEVVTVSWIYGINRFCKDVEFMLRVEIGIYWRICWSLIAPGVMIVISLYMFLNYTPLLYKSVEYPQTAYTIGWIIWLVGVSHIPVYAIYCIHHHPGDTLYNKMKSAIQSKSSWGPTNPKAAEEYEYYKQIIGIKTIDCFNNTSSIFD